MAPSGAGSNRVLIQDRSGRLRIRSGRRNHLDAENLPGVRARSRQRLDRVLRVAQAVVGGRRPSRERSRGVVVHMNSCPGHAGEVDDDVRPFRRAEQQVARQGGRVEGQVIGECCLGYKEPALGPDLDDRRPGGFRAAAKTVFGSVATSPPRATSIRLMFRNRALQAFRTRNRYRFASTVASG